MGSNKADAGLHLLVAIAYLGPVAIGELSVQQTSDSSLQGRQARVPGERGVGPPITIPHETASTQPHRAKVRLRVTANNLGQHPEK